ncbi:hypothetical protein HPB48_009498 [Haemaphysalis longicornis]|uniref:Cullin N-terminal domain-containing protein n=1 Tax=Haemaphysalis longicornis TaxID=44386 RepID=A0A9J6GD76_HAELO|nr:hypothetical protein HPB48_009498 [Haemaphysalis longicornis]
MASAAPLAHASPMKQPIDRNRVWDDLREGIELLYVKGRMTQSRYIQLYTHVCDFVITISSGDAGVSVPGGGKSSLLLDARATGYDLYERLERFLQTHLETILSNGVNSMERDVTHFYSSEWDRFRASSKTLSNIFFCLDRIWFAREQDDPKKEGVRDLSTVHAFLEEILSRRAV